MIKRLNSLEKRGYLISKVSVAFKSTLELLISFIEKFLSFFQNDIRVGQ